MGSMFMGYTIGVSSFSWITLTYVYQISTSPNKTLYEGLFTSAMPLAAGFGALLTFFLLERMGRRPFFIMTDLVGIAGSLLFSVAHIWVGILARFICGLVVGFNSTVVPIYITETSPKLVKGLCGSFNQGFICFGCIVATTLCLFFPQDTDYLALENTGEFYWRFVYGFPVIICCIRLLGLLFVYRKDTPIYLIEQGKEKQAEEEINRIYKPEFIQ